MIKTLLTNWKTTSTGVGLVVTGLVHLAFVIYGAVHGGHALTEVDVTATAISILGGAGLAAAGDASQSVKKEPQDPALS